MKNNKQFILRFLKSINMTIYEKTRNTERFSVLLKRYENDKYTSLYRIIIDMVDNFINADREYILPKMEEIYLKYKYNKTRLQVFNDFLIKHNIYDMFYQNFNNNQFKLRGQKLNENFNDFLEHTQLKEIFAHAFKWSKTPQGYNFWYHHHANLFDVGNDMLYKK